MTNSSMVHFTESVSPSDFEVGKILFKEYAIELQLDLSFQNFTEELEQIDQQYARPSGILIIAYHNETQPVGCFGIRRWTDEICELKRMYVRPVYRGQGLGNQILQKAIDLGKELGYDSMRLDTLPSMQSAIRLYVKFGFIEIAPYRFNPISGATFFEKDLHI